MFKLFEVVVQYWSVNAIHLEALHAAGQALEETPRLLEMLAALPVWARELVPRAAAARRLVRRQRKSARTVWRTS